LVVLELVDYKLDTEQSAKKSKKKEEKSKNEDKGK